MLNSAIFQMTKKHLKFEPGLYCFASRLNTQLTIYISYKPDCSSKVTNSPLVQQFSGYVIPGTICGDPT